MIKTILLSVCLFSVSCSSIELTSRVKEQSYLKTPHPLKHWKKVPSEKGVQSYASKNREAFISSRYQCGEESSPFSQSSEDMIVLHEKKFSQNDMQGTEKIFEGLAHFKSFHLNVTTFNQHDCWFEFAFIAAPENYENHVQDFRRLVKQWASRYSPSP